MKKLTANAATTLATEEADNGDGNRGTRGPNSIGTITFPDAFAKEMTNWALSHGASDLAGAPLLHAARDGSRLIETHASSEARIALDDFAACDLDALVATNLFEVRELEATPNDREPALSSRLYALPLAALSMRCGALPAAVTNENGGVFDRHVVQKRGLKLEKRSDGGGELGPHSEHAFKGRGDHGRSSPAVDTLCLAGLRNPDSEPTGFALLGEVLPLIAEPLREILARPIFGLDPPDSSSIKETMWGRSILTRRRGHLEIAYRDDKVHVPDLDDAREAIEQLRAAIRQVSRSVTLTPGVAWLANNARTLHWRDQVRNSDRWLIRTFGFAASTPVIASDTTRPELVEY